MSLEQNLQNISLSESAEIEAIYKSCDQDADEFTLMNILLIKQSTTNDLLKLLIRELARAGSL